MSCALPLVKSGPGRWLRRGRRPFLTTARAPSKTGRRYRPRHASGNAQSLGLNPALRVRHWRFGGIMSTRSGFPGAPHVAIAEPFQHAKPDDNLARRNAMVLAVAQALAGGNNTVIVSTASIVGAVLAPDKGLATLPITAMVFGMWFGTLPLGVLARRFGRRFALQC